LIKNNPCNLLIHPLDAANLKLNGDTEIKVKSRVGEVVIPFETTEEIMRGTVSIPHGWGHKGKIQLEVAQSSPGISINDLTDETFIDELTGNAALNGVPVTLEAV
jgi:anaerobic selenocysteine-containing dehydrogenase